MFASITIGNEEIPAQLGRPANTFLLEKSYFDTVTVLLLSLSEANH